MVVKRHVLEIKPAAKLQAWVEFIKPVPFQRSFDLDIVLVEIMIALTICENLVHIDVKAGSALIEGREKIAVLREKILIGQSQGVLIAAEVHIFGAPGLRRTLLLYYNSIDPSQKVEQELTSVVQIIGHLSLGSPVLRDRHKTRLAYHQIQE
ncbi:hypothetical protein ES703_104460 [subsurface metagenome]